MDNRPVATMRSDIQPEPPRRVEVLPDDLTDSAEEASPTNLAERMENWGSD